MLYLKRTARGTGGCLEVSLGRPDVAKELRRAKPSGVYFCGGRSLSEHLEEECRRAEMPFHAEDFCDPTFADVWPRWGRQGGAE